MTGATAERSALAERLESPLAALAPWIVMAVLEEPLPFGVAAGAALGVTLAIVVLMALEGVRPKLLELVDVAFFAALTGLALVGPHEVRDFLERWAGPISAGTLALIGLGSLLCGRPFTTAYARELEPPEHWGRPGFRHTNVVLTAAWTAAFAVTGAAGAVSAQLLGRAHTFWAGWTVEAGAQILATQFSRWYPAVVRARKRRSAGVPTGAPPTVAHLIFPLCPYVILLGALSLAFESAPDLVGVALIVVGILLTRWLAPRAEASPPASRT